MRVLKTALQVLRDWGREKPFQLTLIVIITFFSALVIVFLPTLATLFTSENTQVEPQPTLDMTFNSVPMSEPTPLAYEIDVAFIASIELANCELDAGCEIPVWESHERNVLVGVVPEGNVVDISSCFYPLVRQEQLEPDNSGRAIISTFNAYTIEGLWCEMYYLSPDGSIVKGMIQYWNLSVISYEQEVIIPTQGQEVIVPTQEPEIDATNEADEEPDESG